MSEPRTRLIALLVPVAPDLAAELWSVSDVADVPRASQGERL
jgi:hypothetical protein